MTNSLPPNEPYIGSDDLDAITLGRLVTKEDGVAEKIRYGGDQHVVVIGPNGKGKGACILTPNLLSMAGNKSIVVVDPKGELAAMTAPLRRKLGRVVIINPFGVLTDWRGYEDLESDGFNPLTTLDPKARSFNADASLMAEAMVSIDPHQPHWGYSGRALIAAIIMKVVIDAKAEGTTPTMSRVRALLNQPSAPVSVQNPNGLGIPKMAFEMMNSGIEGLVNKAAQFTDWNKEIQSIASTARVQTEPFDDDAIAADLKKPGYDFRQLRATPTTVYLILPPEMMDRQSKWLRLVISTALKSVLRARKPREAKVLFMMDEFYNLGNLPIISSNWAVVRGYSIAFMPVLQDLNQLKHHYPELWETFLGMAGAIVSFSTSDKTTSEHLAWMAGKKSFELKTKSESYTETSGESMDAQGNVSHSTGRSTSTTSNVSIIEAPVVTPHTLRGLKRFYMVGFMDGINDMMAIYAPPYWHTERGYLLHRENPYQAASAGN